MNAYQFEGKVLGAGNLAKLIGFAPERITTTIRRRLYVERNKFVGNRKKRQKGSFTSSVMRRKRRGRPGTMPINVAAMFRGFVKVGAKDSVDRMTLRMGILKKHPRGFTRGIMELQKGFTHTSSKIMPIPVYDNLAKVGISSKFTKSFHQMIASGELVTIQEGGNVLFISENLIEQGGNVYDSLLWYGTHRMTARANNFGFIRQWNTRWPKVHKRLQNAVNRTVRSIEKGYVRAR